MDKRPAELVDVYPTLLKAAGIEVPSFAVGEDLMSDSALRSANFCALHERKKVDAGSYTEEDIIGGEFYDHNESLNQQTKMTAQLLKQLKMLE